MADPDRSDARPPAARVQPAVHAGGAGARLRLRRRDRVRRGAARSVAPRSDRLPAHRIDDGGGAERREQRARIRSTTSRSIASTNRSGRCRPGACRCATRGGSPSSPTLIALVLAWLVAPGGRHECFWLVFVAVDLHLHLFGAAAADQARGHLGERHDRDPARRPAEGRGLVVGEDHRRARAVVHRRDLRAVPPRRVDDQGFRRHGGGRARRLPDAADHLRREARRLDDFAVVRRAVRDDLGRRVDRRADRQLRPAADAARS